VEFNQGYGSTETTSLTTATFKKQKTYDYNACGNILASIQLKFVDPLTGTPVPVGEVSSCDLIANSINNKSTRFYILVTNNQKRFK
jgi:long-subunit acyl-CoA synthetase (AMP-forming)